MTESVLALIPQYGMYLIFIVVMLACLGIPLPSSILVLTSGSLAASHDLVYWQVFCVSLLAFIIGDQCTYHVARALGPPLLERLRNIKRLLPLVEKSESMLDKHGPLAVILSRTLFSPVGPYVGYVSGAIRMSWWSFSMASILGASLWTASYSIVGYLYAGELPQVSSLVVSALIVSVSAFCSLACAVWLVYAWRRFEPAQSSQS